MRRIFAIVLSLIVFAACSTAHAQSITTDISIEMIPSDPSPGSTVILRASSFSGDIAQASLVWKYNNVTIAEGVGKTSVSVVAPQSGATGIVTVTGLGSQFNNATATTVIRPASIDMLWEAVDAYTPPFYKGKALLPANGLVRFVAIPSANAPKGVSYTWSRNGSALPDDSGYNRSSVVFAHSEFNSQEMVEVSASGGFFTGNGTLRVTPSDPTLVTYQNKEGYIDFANGFTDSMPLTQAGVVLHFEPYYFSAPRGVLADLNFDLTIDGQSVSPVRANEVGLSRPNNGGQSKVSLAITTVAYSLQNLKKTLTLLF